MSRYAVTSLLVGALLLLLTAPAAAARSGPAGASVQLVTSGLAFGDFAYPLAAGKKVTIERHVLDPGEVVRWNTAGTTVAINETGQLQNFPGCTAQQLWRAFPAYYTVRSKQLGTLGGVTANLGDKQVILFTITSAAVGAPQTDAQLHRHSGEVVDPITPAAGCPNGPAAETTTLAVGAMSTTQDIDLVDHNQIAVYRHTLPAGYNSGWYAPYDPTFILPVSGEFTTEEDCGDAKVRRAGDAFVAGRPMRARSAAPAEYLSVSWNIQNGFPVDQPFYVPGLPPTDCADSPLQ